MRAAVGIEIRRPGLLVGFGLLLIGQLWLMLTEVTQWQGIWPMASAAVSAPWVFLAPAAAGLSAYEASQRERPAEDAVVWRATSSSMLLTRMLLATGVVGVGALCAVVVNIATAAPPGFLWPSYLVVALSLAIWSVAVGLLMGSFGGPVWFPPVVAVLVALLRIFWYQGAGSGSPGAGFERIFLEGRPWNELDPLAVAAAVAEAVLIVILALLAPVVVTWVRARRAGATYKGVLADYARPAVLAVAGAVCAGLVLGSPPVVRYRTPPEEFPCTDTRPQVCVWPENASLLPVLAERASRAASVSSAVDGRLMARIDEFGLGDGDSFIALGQGTWFFSDTLAGVIADSLAPVRCDPVEGDPNLDAFLAARLEVAALFQLQIEDRDWPTGSGRSSGVDAAEMSHIWRASTAERDAWVSGRVASMRQIAASWCE